MQRSSGRPRGNGPLATVKRSIGEQRALAGPPFASEQGIAHAAQGIARRGEAKHVAETVGGDGALLVDTANAVRLPAIPARAASAVRPDTAFSPPSFTPCGQARTRGRLPFRNCRRRRGGFQAWDRVGATRGHPAALRRGSRAHAVFCYRLRESSILVGHGGARVRQKSTADSSIFRPAFRRLRAATAEQVRNARDTPMPGRRQYAWRHWHRDRNPGVPRNLAMPRATPASAKRLHWLRPENKLESTFGTSANDIVIGPGPSLP